MTTQTRDPAEAPRRRTVAFVFPGQGSQYVGMGADLVKRSPAAADAYRRADEALGIPLSKMILEGPADELDLTVNAQPAILATSYAFLEAMRRRRWRRHRDPPKALAGHSAGQYAAAVAANAIDYADALRLVRERGRIMQERGIEGGMGAVIGLSDEQVEEVVDAASEHGEIAVANQNAPGQIVLSGVIPALVFALEMSKTVGARKAVRLTVSVASHSPLMRRAHDEFGRVLALVPSAIRRSRCSATSTPPSSTRPTGCAASSPSISSTGSSGPRACAAWPPAASPTSSRSARAASSPA